MSNSSLVNIRVPADPTNYSGSAYRKPISNVTWHHMAGILTAEQCGKIFARKGRGGSAHYGIGSDGLIGQYVGEENVAWHCGNWANNQCSVGIEISNSALGGNWPVGEQQFQLAVKLTADIMKRNGIAQAVKGKTLTWHSMYQATVCPGDYLRSQMDRACEEVNKILRPSPTPTPTPTGFLPAKGYWCRYDKDERVNTLSKFMRKTFPSYTPKAALGPAYGDNLWKSIKEFQRRAKAAGRYNDAIDGNTGPKTYAALKSYGFKG